MIRVLKHSLFGFFATSCLAATCWRNTSCTFPEEPAFPGPWERYIHAPKTRNPGPARVLSLATLQEVNHSLGTLTLDRNGSGYVFDFGVEVGGISKLRYTLEGDAATLGLAWTEAKDYVGYTSDTSNGNFRGKGGSLLSPDGALLATLAPGTSTYEVPVERLRGGFRYLVVYLLTNGTSRLDIEDVSVEIVFQPTWSNLRAYQGYFYSDDDELNRIWYSGAYTLQTNSAPTTTGRVATSRITSGGWLNNATAGIGASVVLDGAKRDRWIWPSDTGVALPSAFYSTGDLESARNSLQTLYDNQASNGVLPTNGPPILNHGSETYHMWAMIGTYNYFLFSNDTEFLNHNWPRYLRAMEYLVGRTEADGILNCSGRGDWGRYMSVTNGSAPSMILYRTLTTGAKLARYVSPAPVAASNFTLEWLSRAKDLRAAIFAHFWDPEKGAFRDGWRNRTLYPQDANSQALAFGVVEPASPESLAVSTALTQNWTPIGPACPELPGNISPFISSIELEAHFAANRPDRALKLMHALWGWYLRHPNGTESTVIEGYLVDGTWGYRGTAGYGNDASYVSHAHGWGSGPITALTNSLVGLRVSSPGGQEWILRPSLGTVSEAEAGFTTPIGKFSARYKVRGATAAVEWSTPVGTRGWLDLGPEPRWVEGGIGRATFQVPTSSWA